MIFAPIVLDANEETLPETVEQSAVNDGEQVIAPEGEADDTEQVPLAAYAQAAE